jgi:hypothetical protein
MHARLFVSLVAGSLIAVAGPTLSAWAADWPTFRGPGRTGPM